MTQLLMTFLIIRLAVEDLQKEVSCALAHFSRVLSFPGFNPENREMVAEQIASIAMQIKESIFKTDVSFEDREEIIKDLKNLILK